MSDAPDVTAVINSRTTIYRQMQRLEEVAGQVQLAKDVLNETANTLGRYEDQALAASPQAKIGDVQLPDVKDLLNRTFVETIKRVNRGIGLLDAYVPEWWHSVSLGTLDLSSSTACICGQVFGPKAAEMVDRAYAKTQESPDDDEANSVLSALGGRYGDHPSGFSVAECAERLELVVPNMPDEVAETVADNPALFGFNSDIDLYEDIPLCITYEILGMLWEAEILRRQHLADRIGAFTDKVLASGVPVAL